ncbi:MAG TPA: hypothetical protein VFV80_02545 [Geminicoccaceae bacterium]|nr:hypothetical protein [Geminicoccaceae bacterium]
MRKISAAQAAASRRNGAKSRGPRTAAGRARVARNALKHGLCARRLVLLEDEDAAAFGAFEAALREELAPMTALQADLVARIVVAAWRARRADRFEAAVLGRHLENAELLRRSPQAMLGLGLMSESGTRAMDTLLRYRGSALAELFRSLAALKMLQAESTMPPPALPRLLDAVPNKPGKALQNNSLADRGEHAALLGTTQPLG